MDQVTVMATQNPKLEKRRSESSDAENSFAQNQIKMK